MPTNKVVFLCGFMTIQGKQISARGIEIEKEIAGTMHFLEITKQQFIILKNSKIQSNVWHFFPLLSLNPYFLFGYQEHLLSSAFSA